MSARLGFFSSKRGTEAVHLPKGRARRLDIQLPRLSQECGLTEVVGLEQRARGFANGAGEDGRIDANKIPLVEVIVYGLLDLVTNAQTRALEAGPKPEMAVIQEELDPVLFGLDRVFLRSAE